MKTKFRLAMWMAVSTALLLGFGLISTSHGTASRPSTQATDQPQSESTTAKKKKKKKPATDSTDSAKPPQGEEAAIYGLIQSYPNVQKLGEFTDLRGRLLQAIRDERRASGESPTLYRLSALRQAMDSNLSQAIAAQATKEANNPGAIPQAGQRL